MTIDNNTKKPPMPYATFSDKDIVYRDKEKLLLRSTTNPDYITVIHTEGRDE